MNSVELTPKSLKDYDCVIVATHHTAYDWQINPSFGGPLAKDKLWFYFTYKYQDAKVYVPSSKGPGSEKPSIESTAA